MGRITDFLGKQENVEKYTQFSKAWLEFVRNVVVVAFLFYVADRSGSALMKLFADFSFTVLVGLASVQVGLSLGAVASSVRASNLARNIAFVVAVLIMLTIGFPMHAALKNAVAEISRAQGPIVQPALPLSPLEE